MEQQDYIKGMDPYMLLDGIENIQENNSLEKRSYEELIQHIKEKDDPKRTMLGLNDLAFEIARNYFCKGLRIGMRISLSLNKEDESEDL